MPFVDVNIDAIIKEEEEINMKNTLKQVLESQLKRVQVRVTAHLEVYEALINEQASLEAQLVTASYVPSAQEALKAELSDLIQDSCNAVTFKTINSITIAACLAVGNREPLIGIAKCDPTDEYNETIGKLIALRRALGMHVDASNYGKEKIDKTCENCKFEAVMLHALPCSKCFAESIDESVYWQPVPIVAPVPAEPVKPDYTGMKDFGRCYSCSHDLDVNVEDYCEACVSKNMNGDDWEPAIAAVVAPIAPNSNLEGLKLCINCAHKEKAGSKEPCKECIISPPSRFNWEPFIPEVKATDYTLFQRCGGCAHMLVSTVCDPCNKCKHINKTVSNDAWVPSGKQL